MERHIRHILVTVLVLLCCLNGRTAARDVVTEANYERWNAVPSKTLRIMASNYLYDGQIDSSLVCYTILTNRYNRQLSDSVELEAITAAHVMLGVIYTGHLYDYQKAYQHIYQAEELTKRHPNQTEQQLGQLFLAKANLMYDLKYVESNYAYQMGLVDSYRKAFVQASKTGDHYIESISLTNLVYLGMKHPDKDDITAEAQQFLSDVQQHDAQYMGLDKGTHATDSIIMKEYMMNMAEGYLAFHNQDFAQALSFFKAMPRLIYDQNNNATTTYIFVAGVCQYFTLRAMNRDNEALRQLFEMEQFAQAHQLTHLQLEACRMRYDWLVEHHRDAEARACLLEYLQLKDQFMQDSKLSKAETGKFLYELQNISDDMREQEHRSQTLKLILLGVIVFAVVVLALLALLAMKYREVRSKNRALYDRMNELMEAEAVERKLLEQEAEATPEDTTKYRNNQMDEETKSQLMHRVFMLMETCDEVYQPNFTLARLAELAEATQNNVSQVINDRYKVNFNVFLAEYRVKEACRRMQEGNQYNNLSVEGIAASVGIKSRSNFSVLFKRVTGLTPAAYMRQARTSPESLPPI